MSEYTYTQTKDDNGNDYLCPLTAEGQWNAGCPEDRDDCFEKNVGERYSGNFTVA